MVNKFNRAVRRHHAARVRAHKRDLVARLGYTVEVTGEAHADYLLRYAHKSRACHKFPLCATGRREMARDMRAMPAPDFPEETLEDLIRKCPHYSLRGVRLTACEALWEEIDAEIEWLTWQESLEDDPPLVDMDVEDDWQRPMSLGQLMAQRLA